MASFDKGCNAGVANSGALLQAARASNAAKADPIITNRFVMVPRMFNEPHSAPGARREHLDSFWLI